MAGWVNNRSYPFRFSPRGKNPEFFEVSGQSSGLSGDFGVSRKISGVSAPPECLQDFDV